MFQLHFKVTLHFYSAIANSFPIAPYLNVIHSAKQYKYNKHSAIFFKLSNFVPYLHVTHCEKCYWPYHNCRWFFFLFKIDQNIPFVQTFDHKTEDKLHHILKNGWQNKVIIALKSHFLQPFLIAQKTAFFSSIIMAPPLVNCKCSWWPCDCQNTLVFHRHDFWWLKFVSERCAFT